MRADIFLALGLALAFVTAASGQLGGEAWSGTVTFTRTTARSSDVTSGDATRATSKHSERRANYRVAVRVVSASGRSDGGAQLRATAVVTASGSEQTATHGHDTGRCGDRPNLIEVRSATTTEYAGTATEALGGRLSMYDDGSYRIEFERPRDLIAEGTRTIVSTVTGDCQPWGLRPFHDREAITRRRRMEGELAMRGRVDPSAPGTFRGKWTRSEPIGGPADETVIVWDLRRESGLDQVELAGDPQALP